jgi:hypothetical protein
MFIIEDYELENPNWDSSTDTIDTLNREFHRQSTEALIAGAGHISQEQISR